MSTLLFTTFPSFAMSPAKKMLARNSATLNEVVANKNWIGKVFVNNPQNLPLAENQVDIQTIKESLPNWMPDNYRIITANDNWDKTYHYNRINIFLNEQNIITEMVVR